MSEDLKDRFKSHQPDESDDEESGSETDERFDSDRTEATPSDATEAESKRPRSEIPVRDRTQVPMYLSGNREEAIKSLYNEVDGRAKIAGEGGISKNDEFYPAVVDFVTDEYRDEFLEFLDLQDN
ncbi:hypothetical protein ACOJIV_18285 [Haloarcula sp. AONF1]